jgi:hypothetical protein
MTEVGSGQDNLGNTDVNAIIALNTLEYADVALEVSYIANKVRDREYEYSYNYTVSNDALDYLNLAASRTELGTMGNLAAATVPTFNETYITVYPSIRKKVGKTWVLAKVGIRMVSGEQNDSISGSLTAGQNVTDPTYWAFGALTSVYRRSYSMECSIDGDATGFGGLLCAAYPIKPNVWFKAGVGLDGYPLSGSGTFAQVDNITSNGGTAPVTTKQTQTYNMDYDRTAGGMLGGATLEAYPTPSLMVAGGIIYQSLVTSVYYS